jgi:hypothetical protein
MKHFAEEIGQRRLQELALNVGHGVTMTFDVKELGEYSLRRKPVLVVLTGLTSNQQWVLMPCTRQNIAEHRGHCYLVKGRKVERIEYKHYTGSFERVMSKYESADLSAPLSIAKTDDIFRAGRGARCRKKPQISGSRKPTAHGTAGTIGNYITTKRFENSRLTCVCKCQAI